MRDLPRAATLAAVKTRQTSVAADANNRSRLLHAAADVFSEFGFEGASLRSIADAAGVSFQLIAYYFGSKEELWIASVDFLFERYLETGKGLGFTSSGNLAEQFHNHLRLLLTDMLQRPQLRKIWIQEYLADSPRYHNVIRPKIKHLYDTLARPYFEDVVRRGIVERFTADEIGLLWSSVVQNNVVYPYYVELTLGLPAGSAKSVERQVDLLFAILTDKREDEADATPPQLIDEPPDSGAAKAVPSADDTVVYAWKESKDGAAERARVKQLEIENLHLKQLAGSLALEKKLLLDRLAVLEPTTKK
jgi:TetR/AcrR family transcriptional regulator